MIDELEMRELTAAEIGEVSGGGVCGWVTELRTLATLSESPDADLSQWMGEPHRSMRRTYFRECPKLRQQRRLHRESYLEMRMVSSQGEATLRKPLREVVLALFLVSLVSLVSCVAPGTPDPASSPADAAAPCAGFFSTRSWSDRAEPHFEAISPAIACFDGDMDEMLPGQVESWLAEGPPNLSRLLAVRSPGGDAAQGISAAELLQRHGVAVYVHQVCASSCANYLFAGVTRRMVSPDALILFHGGLSAALRSEGLAGFDAFLSSPAGARVSDPDEQRRRVAADFDRDLQRQRLLFESVGVSEDIVLPVERVDIDRLDSDECGGPDEAPRRAVFFTLEQLSSMGIHIEHGRPADSPAVVNRSIRALGGSSVACRFPAGLLE